jgi:hypothetical protein
MMPLSAKQNKAYPTVAMAYYTLSPFLHKQTNKQTSKQNVHSLKMPTNPRMNE